MTIHRRPYLVTVKKSNSQEERTRMRNALYRLGASEVLPGLYLAHLTAEEWQRLTQRSGVRVKVQ